MAACPACGKTNEDSARFCSSCGSLLAESGGREERKVVTILFCDIVEFTARFDLADPEDVGQVLSAYHERVRREIERFGGRVEKFIGDAVMAVYGAPRAHEDDAERAVLSATRILSAIQELNESSADAPLAVRIGIESGEAVVTLGDPRPDRSIALGDVVNTASRLQTVAPTNGIVVGELTYRLTRDRFDYEPLEPVHVKGKAARLPIWSVRSARGRYGAEMHRRPSTPLVDRKEELEVLKRAFAVAVRERSVQLATVEGEAGVGKSRTLLELFRYLDDRPEIVFWRQGRCLPFGEGVTFWALSGIVKAHAGILDSDGVDEARGKLATSVAALIGEPTEREWIRARLAPLIGLDESPAGGIERTEVFNAWRRYLEAIAIVHPLVMVLEDIHWADGAMLEFVQHVVDRSARVPILVVCTARPELFDRDPRWRFGRRNARTVSLGPLGEEDTRHLLSHVFPPWVPADVRRSVGERSGGNPLFAEEFARVLEDRGALVDEDSAVEGLSSLGSPESVQAIIAARLDGLSASEKTLLQDASVVGRAFWPGVLVDVAGSSEEIVHDALRRLTRKELVRRARVSSVENETEFSFAHALVRDVAYGQIPRVPRAHKHVAVARWIEQIAGERVSDSAELLAHHYEVALGLLKSAGITQGVEDLEVSARRSWVIAGERAMALDIERAEHCFDEALRLLPASHHDRPRVLANKAEACLGAGRLEQAERTFQEAAAAFGEQGDRVGQGACFDRLATVLWERGDEGWRGRLALAVETLEGQPPGPELADCYASVASDGLVSSRFDDTIEWADRAIALATALDLDRLIARPLSYRGMARACLGDLGGLDDLERALAIAEGSGSSRTHAQILYIMAELQWALDGPAKGLELATAGAEFAERRGVMDEVAGCRALALGPLFDLGKWNELERSAAEVVRWSSDVGGDYTAVQAQPWRAQVLLWRGKTADASSLAGDAMVRARVIRDPQVLVPSAAAAGLVAAREARTDEAAELVEELEGTTDGQMTWYREQFLADLARICVWSGRLDLAQGQIDRANAFAPRHVLSLDTARAILAEGMGDLEQAARVYLAVAPGWTELGHILEAGMAWLGAGRCLTPTQGSDARDHARRATEIFVRLDAEPLIAEAKILLDSAPDGRGSF